MTQSVLFKHKNLVRALIIIILGAMFYFYEFAVRVVPSVLTEQLMQAFHLNAVSLSSIAALFYIAYVLMQIPSGLLYDRYGPRYLLTGAVLICALGTLLFAITNQVWLLSLGRFMTGFGGAFAFIGVLVLASSWFPARSFALIAGIVQFLGSMGALVGEGPLSAAAATYGWRHTLVGLCMIGMLIAFFIWLIVRDRPEHASIPMRHKFGAGELHRLRVVLSSRQSWLIGLYNFAIWTPMIIFPALWGVSYLRSLYHIGTTEAASMVELIWLGVAAGSPIFAWWSQKIGRRILPLSTSAALGLVSILLILFVPMSMHTMCLLMLLFGLGASGQSLAFAVVNDNNSESTIGTAVGFNNLCTVFGGIFILPLVGLLIKWGWNGRLLHGIPIYTLSEYRHAMLIIPASLVLAFIMSQWCIRETRCQPTEVNL